MKLKKITFFIICLILLNTSVFCLAPQSDLDSDYIAKSQLHKNACHELSNFFEQSQIGFLLSEVDTFLEEIEGQNPNELTIESFTDISYFLDRLKKFEEHIKIILRKYRDQGYKEFDLSIVAEVMTHITDHIFLNDLVNAMAILKLYDPMKYSQIPEYFMEQVKRHLHQDITIYKNLIGPLSFFISEKSIDSLKLPKTQGENPRTAPEHKAKPEDIQKLPQETIQEMTDYMKDYARSVKEVLDQDKLTEILEIFQNLIDSEKKELNKEEGQYFETLQDKLSLIRMKIEDIGLRKKNQRDLRRPLSEMEMGIYRLLSYDFVDKIRKNSSLLCKTVQLLTSNPERYERNATFLKGAIQSLKIYTRMFDELSGDWASITFESYIDGTLNESRGEPQLTYEYSQALFDQQTQYQALNQST